MITKIMLVKSKQPSKNEGHIAGDGSSNEICFI